MMVLDRRDLGRFRTVLRRCGATRSRSSSPPVVLQRHPGGLTLWATLENATLALERPDRGGPPARPVIPVATLAAVEGNVGEVSWETTAPGHTRCRWQERGEPKELDSASPSPDGQPTDLPPRGNLAPVDPALLTALHACGQTAGRQAPDRYDFTRLQVRGSAGQVVGTDGHQLLVWGGLTLPFPDDVLVPALPVFGARELAGEVDVRTARTPNHLVVAAGPWTVWLEIDATARFPDTATVVAKAPSQSRLVIDDRDAAALLKDLQPGLRSADEVEAVALVLGSRPALRWPADSPGRRGPLNLIRSTGSGLAATVSVDPRFLVRALALGFRKVSGAAGAAILHFRDDHRSYLVASCGPSAKPAGPAENRPALSIPLSAESLSQKGDQPMNPESNGRAPSEPTAANDILDPLTEAEALRAALTEVARRIGWLIVALRQMQKQRRALQTAWSSLRNLQIGPKEEP